MPSPCPNVEELIRTLPLFTTIGETNTWYNLAAALKQRYKKFLICGLGGSILTTQALLPLAPTNAVTVLDSIDPRTLNCLKQTDLSDTCIIFISKSGSTSEILCQVQALQPKEAVVITQIQDSPLLSVAQKNGWTIIPHHDAIGGRFSAFTAVGCLPCLLMGLDPLTFIEGAKSALQDYSSIEMDARVLFDAYQSGHKLHVLWGYSDYVNGLLLWCCQLIAESLGKKTSEQEPFGFQPLVNKGTLDQHSQLQLYLDGPHKCMFTLLRVNCDTIPLTREHTIVTDLRMLLYQKHTPSVLLKAHFENTKFVLEKAGHRVREIILPDLSEKSFGFVMMRFILETLSIAHLAGVNPFDQPAVESSKRFMERFL